MNCDKVWNEIRKLNEQGVDTNALEDAFADFECAWPDHVDKYHPTVTSNPEQVAKLYDRMLLREFRRVMDEVFEAYHYVNMPTEKDLEELDSGRKDIHIFGKLNDLLTYLRYGKFW